VDDPRPTEHDHEIIASRNEQDPLEKSTVTDLLGDPKIPRKLLDSADEIKEVRDADMGNDGTEKTVLKVYRDSRKKQIQTLREEVIDSDLSRKEDRLRTTSDKFSGILKTLDENQKILDATEKETAKKMAAITRENSNASTFIERKGATASKYLKTLADLRRRKKGGRKAGLSST